MMKRFLSMVALLAVVLCATIGAQPTVYAAFSDVSEKAWYAETVEAMAAEGTITGFPDGTFRPNQTISAAEFVTIVTRCAGLEAAASESSYWAAGALQAALQAGWYDWDEIPPTGETFSKPISRQLAVKILMRGLLPDVRGEYSQQAGKIRDLADLDGRYYEAVFAAYAAGVAQGNETGKFLAKSSLTRAEACALIQRATMQADLPAAPSQPGSTDAETPVQPTTPVQTVQGGVAENGFLQVKGTTLCNQKGEPIVLRGMSSHGVHWFSQYTSAQSIANTASYGANLFRVAMYTGEGGYLSQPENVKKQTIQAVDAAIAQDMYVILDWHILSDGDPMEHLSEAKAFFREMAQRYKDQPAVLFEICNEPNGNITWAGNVKPYAQELVNTIRAIAPNNIILIGSPTWSQDIDKAAADPVKGSNLMYTCHFYAGTHGQWLRDRIDNALRAGLPIFISEWGTSAADGNGGVYLKESAQWLNFLEARGISWANWSLCDKNETSAALKSGTSANGVWTEANLTESGKFVFSRFRG